MEPGTEGAGHDWRVKAESVQQRKGINERVSRPPQLASGLGPGQQTSSVELATYPYF